MFFFLETTYVVFAVFIQMINCHFSYVDHVMLHLKLKVHSSRYEKVVGGAEESLLLYYYTPVIKVSF